MDDEIDQFDDFFRNGGDKSVQEIVSKLKFISKINEDEILDVGKETVGEKGWYTSFYRTFIARDECRESALDFFRSVTNEALEKINFYIKKETEFYHNVSFMILTVLLESINGIENYKKTYRKDKKYVSDIETFLLLLDTKINECKKNIEVINERKEDEYENRKTYFS